MAVICSLWSNHPMVQDFQSTGSRHFLFSEAERRETMLKSEILNVVLKDIKNVYIVNDIH